MPHSFRPVASPKNPLLRALGFAVLGLCLGLGAWGGRVAYKAYRSGKALEAAQTAFAAGQYEDVLSLVNHYYNPASHSSLNPAWEDLKIEGLLALKRAPELAALYHVAPEGFAKHEAANRLVVAALYQLGERDAALALREAWRNRETDAPAWLFLDVESALFLQQTAKARELLKAAHFTGHAESSRLLRLSYLEADPSQVLALLDQALKADPKDVGVRTARGNVFEAAGQPRMASFEYASAVAAEPDNPVLYHTLGDFYYRIGERPLALTVWSDGAGRTQDKGLWLKAYTWGRLVKTTHIAPLLALKNTTGPDPLAAIWPLLAQTSKESFISLNDFKGTAVLAETPELAFLGVLEALRLNDVSTAALLLQSPALTAHASLAPIPQATLNAYVGLKMGQSFPLARQLYPFKDALSVASIAPTLKGFLSLAQSYAESGGGAPPAFNPEAAQFFASEACLPSLMALADLPAAAIRMNPRLVFDPRMKNEATYAYAQALVEEEGPAAVWAFIPENAPTPQLQLLRAQCGIADSKTRSSALAFLTTLAEHPTIGTQASFLRINAAIEDKDPISAEALLISVPGLLNTVEGQVAFAECAVLENNPGLAEVRFLPVAMRSPKAAEFLCARAVQKEDWPKAIEYLQFLVSTYPDRLDYRQALQTALHNAGYVEA